MSQKLVQKPNLQDAEYLTLIIGLSCRNWLGFLYMWLHIFEFIFATKKAQGCLHIQPGISGPLAIVLVSYWTNEADLLRFVGSPAHVRWMKFIYKHPSSMNLFNETYGKPQRANYINQPKGYAACFSEAAEKGKVI